MKLYNFNDTIIFLKGTNEPIFGSIIFSTNPASDDEVIIKSSNDVIKVSLKQIKLSIFKVTLLQYGFIANESLYSDDNTNYWDKQVEMIRGYKLKPNLNKSIILTM